VLEVRRRSPRIKEGNAMPTRTLNKTSTQPKKASSRQPQTEPAPPRVAIEDVRPRVNGGRFPIKRTIGEHVVVEADVFADGHDTLTAMLLYRRAGEDAWLEVPMTEIGNDRWRASFTVEALGGYEYAVQGWVDRFGSWRHDLSKKFGAGLEVSSELEEGAAIVRAAAARVRPATSRDRAWLEQQARLFDGSPDDPAAVPAALSTELSAMMRRHDDRLGAVTSDPLGVLVERERARVGAWYEMFPRSAGTDPSRSATFDEAAARLPEIAAMGFDVLYLPPIHPIGRSFRKGSNNTLVPDSSDPGSPWAIGSEEGGHMAVEPGLGTIDDFDRFVAAAARHGLEIALDIAYQASPDHPYVGEHPEWFRHRPDGTIKYAENPPKKYQDIYPFDFETDAWRALWEELKNVILFWIEHGVKIFRVDNPHTKPFRFWEWMLAEIRKDHPDAVFLSEAFTRPKVMRRLAKLGFSQSYTYFTWRNSRHELEEYFIELTATEVREYMRPNLFANTPDILHEYLQRGGPPAFQIRLVLAATLGASYGIYSGFELAENVPIRPGSEEYLDSEKYQIKIRDYDRPGNLKELIARVNAIRRAQPALQSDWSLRFLGSDNPQIIAYSKRAGDSDPVVAVVNLDPFHMQHGWIHLPLADWGLTADEAFEVHDLLTDERYYWRGEWNYVRLDPAIRPAHIATVRRSV
jgi:starch synthase (maltosyl-transferring)